jgi:hypothetical protein
MDEKIELEIKYTVDDYVRGTFFIQNRLPINKYNFVFVPVLLFIDLSAMFVVFPKEKQTLLTVLTILIPCLVVFFIHYGNHCLWQWKEKRFYRNGN